MKSSNINRFPYEEMLFAHSNKQYGAFVLRTEYSSQLTKSYLLVAAVSIFMLLYLSLHNKQVIPKHIYANPTTFTAIPLPTLEADKSLSKPKPASKTKPESTHLYDLTNPIPLNPVETTPAFNESGNLETPVTETTTGNATDGQGISNGPGINEVPFQKVDLPVAPHIMEAPEVMPSFVGGEYAMMNYFNDNNGLSAIEIQSMDILKKIYVEFIVSEEGSIQEVKLLQSSGNNKLDKEAMRLVKMMPNWIPGKVAGEAIGVRMMLPISFSF